MTVGAKAFKDAGQVGLIAGYDVQQGPWVIGTFGDFAYQSSPTLKFDRVPNTLVLDQLKANWTGHVLVRIGRDFNGWLPYVFGGLALANIEASHISQISATGTIRYHKEDVRVGYDYGVGVEKMLPGGWSGRGEVLYDYWGPKLYNWIPGVRYSKIGVTIYGARLIVARRF